MAKAFADYYENHANKFVNFYVDKHGDAKSANSKRTYNEQFISQLELLGWQVKRYSHTGQEPPQHDKYLLSSVILAEKNPDKFPKLRINKDKCKNLIASMNNTRVVQKDNKFAKDKSSEHNKHLSQEQATHFGDCLDKYLWTRFGSLLKNKSTFVSAKFN